MDNKGVLWCSGLQDHEICMISLCMCGGKKSEGMAFRLIGDWLLIWVCYPCDELLTCPRVYPVSQSVKAGIGWNYPVHLEPITKMLIFSLRYLVGLYNNLIHFCIYNYWNVFGLRSGHWLGCWRISDLLAPRNSFAVYFGPLTVCIVKPCLISFAAFGRMWQSIDE